MDVSRRCGIKVTGSEIRFNLNSNPALPAISDVTVADDAEEDSPQMSQWTKTGKHGRYVARVKMSVPWTKVVRRKTENLETGDILEDIAVTDHDNPNWYRKLPKRTNIKTTFFYTTDDVSGVTAANVGDAPTTLAVPAPTRGEVSEPPDSGLEGTWELDDAFFSGALPPCLTHKPAQQDCWDCVRAKRRNVKQFKGTTKRKPQAYGDILTIEHVNMTEGFGPKSVG